MEDEKSIDSAPIKTKKIRKRKKLNRKQLGRLVTLRARNVPVGLIAQELDVTKNAVEQAIKEFRPLFQELGNIKHYRTIKADLLDAAQIVALKTIVRGADKASMRDGAFSYRILNEASRLEKGLSTQNISKKIQYAISVPTSEYKPDSE
jgi:hypothetical protein